MLEVKDLLVELRGFSLKDITFEVQDGEYFVLLGPTGSGKSILLESIAGLKPLTHGEIKINGRDVTRFNLESRRIGFAYQDYVLFGHLSVRDNISFGLMWRGKKRQEIEKAIDQIVEILGIEELLKKRPRNLSGGESQKIALARAIAIKPDLLILDEPLSAVDPESKEHAERELKALHDRLKLTTIHVTHNFEEAIVLGDRIAVMRGGQILQIGTPEQIFRYPTSVSVARFLMTRNIFEGTTQDSVFDMGGIKLAVSTSLHGKRHASIRPEDIWISREPQNSDSLNSLPGTVTRITERGAVVYVDVDVPPEFTCLILPRSLQELQLKEAERVFITFRPSSVNVF